MRMRLIGDIYMSNEFQIIDIVNGDDMHSSITADAPGRGLERADAFVAPVCRSLLHTQSERLSG